MQKYRAKKKEQNLKEQSLPERTRKQNKTSTENLKKKWQLRTQSFGG